jgi:hypothetical protein
MAGDRLGGKRRSVRIIREVVFSIQLALPARYKSRHSFDQEQCFLISTRDLVIGHPRFSSTNDSLPAVLVHDIEPEDTAVTDIEASPDLLDKLDDHEYRFRR